MADDLENYMIPKHLDAPPMALWMEADTAMLGASGLYVGLATGSLIHLVVATLFTIILARYYSRIKASGGRGLIPQIVYWYFPGNQKNQPISPVIREYRG